jgi:hypothetical protein
MPLKPHPTDPEKMVYVSREYKLPYWESEKELKVPAGYTAEELERDNPYNQWMGENT